MLIWSHFLSNQRSLLFGHLIVSDGSYLERFKREILFLLTLRYVVLEVHLFSSEFWFHLSFVDVCFSNVLWCRWVCYIFLPCCFADPVKISIFTVSVFFAWIEEGQCTASILDMFWWRFEVVLLLFLRVLCSPQLPFREILAIFLFFWRPTVERCEKMCHCFSEIIFPIILNLKMIIVIWNCIWKDYLDR